MAHSHPFTDLGIAGKHLAAFLGCVHGIETAEQMDSCLSWVIVKLCVYRGQWVIFRLILGSVVIKLMASLCRISWPELFRITCLEVLVKHPA